MGVEIQNNFVGGLYCGNAVSDSKFQSDYCTLGQHSEIKNVKQCLKSKIVGNLKSRGFEHVAADFSPKPDYPMTEEEIAKDIRRRQSNRHSAKKCREKQKQEDDNNRKLLTQLKKDKEKLLDVVKKSEEEKNKLLFNLKLLLPDAYITEALKKVPEVGVEKERPATDQYSSTEEIASIDSTDFSGKYILEENTSDGNYVLTSLDNFTGEEGTITGFVDFLEVASEETTVQVIDLDYDGNAKVQSVVYDDQCVSETVL